MADSTDAILARDLADLAGKVLTDLRPTIAHLDRPARKDAGDAAAQRFLADALAEARPDDAVLSEEAVDDPARLTAERVWIIDPLDGTSEYSEDDRIDWAVHVALWELGELTTGAVALPAQERVLDAAEPPALAPWAEGDPIRMVISRSRPPAFLDALVNELGVVPVPCGSAGAKASEVILGRAEVYLHDTFLREWDAAAPAVVAQAAGLHVSHLDGSLLEFNRPEPISGDLLLCRPELAERFLAFVAAVRA